MADGDPMTHMKQIPGKMYSVKVHYWPFEEEDKNLVDEAAYRKRQTEVVKVYIDALMGELDRLICHYQEIHPE